MIDFTSPRAIALELEDAKRENEKLRADWKRVVELCSGDRVTVHEGNAFKHFSQLNKTVIEVRELAQRNATPRAS